MDRLESGNYVIGGYARIRVYGDARIFGGLASDTYVEIPPHRQAPVEILGDSYAEVSLEDGYIVSLGGYSPIPSSWREYSDEIEAYRKILILGGTDVGKSGLTLYLANKMVDKGLKTAIVDTDIGQSDLGPPATIGLAIVDRYFFSYHDIPLHNAYFIGDKMPSGHLLQIVVGASKLAEEGIEEADLLIVNTCGYIRGGAARALKKHLVETIEPDCIAVLDREGENQHILDELVKWRIKTLEVPKVIKPKRMGERRGYRRVTLGKYFRKPVNMRISLRNTILLNTVLGNACYRMYRGYVYGMYYDGETLYFISRGRFPSEYLRDVIPFRADRISFIDTELIKGLLVGLYDGDQFLNIGLVRDFNPIKGELIVWTDVTKSPSHIVFGNIVLDQEFNEVRRFRPGQLG